MDSPTWSPENVRPDEARPEDDAPVGAPIVVTSLAVAAPKRRGSSSNAILVVALLVAVGGVTFAAGRLTAPTAVASRAGLDGGQLPGGAAGSGTLPGAYGVPGAPGDGAVSGGIGGLGAGAMVMHGTVTAVGVDSITLETSAGTTVEVSTDASTTYHGQTAASPGDVTVGATVAVEVNGFRGVGRVAADASAAPAASPGAADAPAQRGQGAVGPALDVTVNAP